MDPLTLLITALLATSPVVTEDDTTLPDGCRPAQAAQRLATHLGADRSHFDEVIAGYANGVGQLEFSATVGGRRAHGKGALDCPTRSIVAFGLGPGSDRMAPLCPAPPRRTHARDRRVRAALALS